MRLFYLVLALFVFSPFATLDAKETNQVVYQQGRFKVHKVMGVCKLEITLSRDEKDYQAILALFASDDYYNELFTERKRIGLANKRVLIAFDQKKPQRIAFVKDAHAKDSYWHWQYLQESHDLLYQIKKMHDMNVTFSTAKKTFKFTVSLKGSGKAVNALRNCR